MNVTREVIELFERRVIPGYFGTISVDTKIDEICIDSLERTEALMDVEELAGFIIDDIQAEKFRTLGDIVQYIQPRIENATK